jgi:hypothetical protein
VREIRLVFAGVHEAQGAESVELEGVHMIVSGSRRGPNAEQRHCRGRDYQATGFH